LSRVIFTRIEASQGLHSGALLYSTHKALLLSKTSETRTRGE